MRRGKPGLSLTLAVHPTSRGFGWVAFEGPLTPYDWGLVGVLIDKNATSLRKIEALIVRFQPETLVLEAFEPANSRRRERIVRLGRAIVALAASRGVEVAIYTVGDVRACFGMVGARSRHEIALAVVLHVDALRHWLPRKRAPWESEPPRIAVFSAAALALTHFQLDAHRLLDELAQDT